MPDIEIEAMGAVSSALDGLDEGQQSRVLRWAAERFGVTLPGTGARSVSGSNGRAEGAEDLPDDEDEGQDGADTGSVPSGSQSFEHFAELYDACSPRDDNERALVGAYWLQVISGKGQWTSFEVNKLLKDLGHGIGSIAIALQRSIDKKPSLVLQLKKSGKSRQARKTYKLSHEGVKFVKSKMTS